MELRKLTVVLAFFVLAALCQTSEGHAVKKRETTNDVDYSDPALADEASDDEAQNDDNGDLDEDEETVNVSIVTRPATYNATAGGTVRLECKLEPAESNAVVQWSGDNDTYSISSVVTTIDRRFHLEKNDLVLTGVRASDTGSYFCEVLQKNGGKIQHNLIVTETPKITRFAATNDGHVTEGSRLVLTCDVTGTPPPQITWSKSTFDLDNNEFNQKLTETAGKFGVNSLTMEPVTREDAGRYYCYAINNIGSSQEALEVIVDAKPRVHVPREVVNADYNVTAVLQCSAHETPTPHIYWFKDNTRIENIEEYYSITTEGPSSNLTIKPKNRSDFGVYTCMARNSRGEHSRSLRLVQSPVVLGLQAEGADLAWTVHSHAPLTRVQLSIRQLDSNTWRTIDVPLPTSDGHEHVIKYSISEQDAAPGKYEVRVKAQNTHQLWSDQDDGAVVEIEEKALPIQQSSVFGAGSNGNQLYTSALSTLLIYLLVRMF